MSWNYYLFSFGGRINRKKMWLFYVVVWGMEFILFFGILLAYAVLSVMGITTNDPFSHPATIYPGVIFTIALAIFVIAVNYMYLAVVIKRLHDRNRNGRWILPISWYPQS